MRLVHVHFEIRVNGRATDPANTLIASLASTVNP
jgi:murein DD-endopeptidase MepM/ murein hydrolase activator NlpD